MYLPTRNSKVVSWKNFVGEIEKSLENFKPLRFRIEHVVQCTYFILSEINIKGKHNSFLRFPSAKNV